MATTLLDHTATTDALETELTRTVALAERIPDDQPIPTCPGWTAADLWEHLGAVHRWTAELLRTRADSRISRREIELDLSADRRWAPWLADGADRLLAELRDIGGSEPVWGWGGSDAHWWSRRQLHETEVHDADAALALGETFEVRPDLAADGIDELLDNLPTRLGWPGAGVPQRDATVHLHATDAPAGEDAPLWQGGEWMITMGDGAVTYEHGHGKGDAAARGPVSELLLVLYGRRAPDGDMVEVLGDPGALDALVAVAAHG